MRFELKALKGRQGLEPLTLDARDAEDAIRQAAAQGYTVLSARRSFSIRGFLPKSSSALSLALFTQELVALLGAGLNLVEALETLAEKEERVEARKIIRGLLDELYEGRSFPTRWALFRMSSRRSMSPPCSRASAPVTCPRRWCASWPTRRRSISCARSSSRFDLSGVADPGGRRRDGVPAGLRRAALQPYLRRHGRRSAAHVAAAVDELGPVHQRSNGDSADCGGSLSLRMWLRYLLARIRFPSSGWL